VPISIVYKKGSRAMQWAALPVRLRQLRYCTPPTFSSTRVSLLDRGMAYAIAHIRGGNEMGEKWREDACS